MKGKRFWCFMVYCGVIDGFESEVCLEATLDSEKDAVEWCQSFQDEKQGLFCFYKVIDMNDYPDIEAYI